MSLNWPALFTKGRCKDIGIPWNEEEIAALEVLMEHTKQERHVVAPFVREGILTVEAYEAAKAGGDKPSTRAELEAEAKALGVNFAPETSDTTLKGQITKARNKAAEEAEKAAAEAAEAEAAAAQAAEEAAKAGGDNE